VLLLWMAAPACAIDILYVDYFGLGQDGFLDTDLKARSHAFDGFVFLPIKFITFGFVYEYRQYKWENSSPRLNRNQLPDNLQMTMMSLGWLQQWTPRWTTLIRFDPGIASDFEDVTWEDCYTRAYLVFLFTVNKQLSLMFGGGYTDQYEFPNPVPILGFDWRPRRDVHFNLMIPDRFHFRFAINKWIWPGFRGMLRGYSFRLSEKEPMDGARIHRRELRLGPILDIRLVADLFLNLECGAIVLNEFDYYDKHENRLLKGDRNGNWYVQTGLAYRFDLANLE